MTSEITKFLRMDRSDMRKLLERYFFYQLCILFTSIQTFFLHSFIMLTTDKNCAFGRRPEGKHLKLSNIILSIITLSYFLVSYIQRADENVSILSAFIDFLDADLNNKFLFALLISVYVFLHYNVRLQARYLIR